MNIAATIAYLRPDAQWSIRGNDLATLIWHGPGDPPTLEELQAAWPDAQRASVVVPFRALAFVLSEQGLYSQVKAAALSTEQGEIWWETAKGSTVQRTHPFVVSLGNALNLTPEQLDAIFASAVQLSSSL